MSTVKVTMDNYNGVCYPGQTIAGRVECSFAEQENFRAVKIKFRGHAETQWHETETEYDEFRKENRSRTVLYGAGENYFDAEYVLVQGGDNVSLPVGRYSYPFSYILPPQLPSSFEGTYGNVRYYIKATIDRPWKFDYEDVVALNVVSLLDLNYLPYLREPTHTSVDKTMCSCWCNDSGALTFNVSLPATGFVPGQEISIGTHVENMTNVSAESVKFKIVEETSFIAQFPRSHTRSECVEIAKCQEGGVGAHGEKAWTACLTVPVRPFPNLKPCSIMNVNYTLEAIVVIPWPHTNLESNQPITIGAVPLSGVTTTFAAGPPPVIPFPLPSGPPMEGVSLPPNLPPRPLSQGDGKIPSAPPPDTSYGSVGAPYSASGGSAPYPTTGGAAAPYSSVGNAANASLYPPPSSGFTDLSALPSYADVQKMNQKSEKSE